MNTRERSAMRALLDCRDRGEALTAHGLDWVELVGMAQRALLTAVLGARAQSLRTSGLDATLRATLRDAQLETASHNARLLAELARTVAALRAAGIECVLLKGAVLLTRHYPPGYPRHTVDIDLLVEPAQLDAAVAALLAAGHTLAPHAARRLPDGQRYGEASSAQPHAYAPLKAPSGVNVDLHFRLPLSGFELRGGAHGLLARAVTVELHGTPLRCASDADLALHLCEHFAFQDFAAPHKAPRLLADLRALYIDGPPWVALTAGPPRQWLAVELARRLYAAAFEPGAGPQAGPLTATLSGLALGDPDVARVPELLSALWGHAHRIGNDLYHRPRYALYSFVPRRDYMAERYGVDSHSPRIRALYVSRLWSAARRSFKGPR